MCCRVGKCCCCISLRAGVVTIATALLVRRKLVHGWVVAYIVVFLHLQVIAALAAAFYIALSLQYNTYDGIYVTAGILLHAGLMLYFWIVVRSYYLELGQQHGEGGPRSTAGKVYSTVPTGQVLPGQGTYSEADGVVMRPLDHTSPA